MAQAGLPAPFDPGSGQFLMLHILLTAGYFDCDVMGKTA